jgi:hypothetical protein
MSRLQLGRCTHQYHAEKLGAALAPAWHGGPQEAVVWRPSGQRHTALCHAELGGAAHQRESD